MRENIINVIGVKESAAEKPPQILEFVSLLVS